MRKLIALSIALAAACGGSAPGSLKQQSRDAMPSKDTVQMGSPSSASRASSADAIQRDSGAGDSSTWVGATVSVSAVFNVGTAWVLGVIGAVTDQEPTSCDATSCTWGPGSGALDPNNFKVVVTKNANGNFDYTLSGQPKSNLSAGFTTFISGTATPSASPHHGSGSFIIDFDAAQKLDQPHGDSGKLTVTYDNVGPAHVTATFLGAKDGSVSIQRDNVVYTFDQDATGGGIMDVGVHNLTTQARFSLHSRWKNDGQGRGDVHASGTASSGGAYDAHLSECWGVAPFKVVYFASDLSIVFGPSSPPSQESSCAYQGAVYGTNSAP
jgi:hypothetical protein